MEVGEFLSLFATVFVLAVLLDAGLIVLWRRLRRRRQVRVGEAPEEPAHEAVEELSADEATAPPAQHRARRWWLIVELVILALWALWVGRAYLNFDPNVVPGDNPYSSAHNEYGSAVQTHHIWTWVKQCGLCAMWNGAERGGYPSFVDVHGSALHPLVAVTTLIWGVVNGSKVALLAALWIGGVAQWWLARVMRLGWLARLWSGFLGVVGGHLAGRMEVGAFGVVLSVAMCSLVFAAALSVARSGSRRATVLLAVTLALLAVAGQGYIQIGLLFIAPAFLFLVFDEKLRLRSVWREYVIAAGIALLLAATFLVPLAHFWPNFTKDWFDADFSKVQPLEYIPLNLVIRDLEFQNSDCLSKTAYPHLNATYIGWLPVLLAALCLKFARREDRRMLLFLSASAVLELLVASAVLLRWLRPLIPAITGVRHPSQIASLVVPPILGLAAYGLDKLFRANWPQLDLSFQASPDQRKVGISLRWLLLIPLVLNLYAVYGFSRTWLHVMRLSEDVPALLQALRTPSLQWVETPFGEHFWTEPAVGMGLKLSPGVMTWQWRGRPFPEPYLEANSVGPPPDSVMVDMVSSVPIYRFEGQRDYAFVQADEGASPCQAFGTGGDLTVECSTDEAGTLIVRENNWTGWYAWRDGERVPLLDDRWLSADAPAGEHQYRFRYLPWDVPLGVLLSLLGAALSVWQWIKHSPFYR